MLYVRNTRAPLAKAEGAFGLRDDAAALRLPPDEELVVTVDALPSAAVQIRTEQGNFEFRLQDLSDGRILAFRAGDVLVERAPTPQQISEPNAADPDARMRAVLSARIRRHLETAREAADGTLPRRGRWVRFKALLGGSPLERTARFPLNRPISLPFSVKKCEPRTL